jgi:predicted nucleic acid-binding protein
MPGVLLDTNILLYAISTNPGEAEKRCIARELLASDDWGLSVQVLQEFFVNATRQPNPSMRHEDAVEAVQQFLLRPIVPSDVALLQKAFDVKYRYGISYWDAAVVAAAILCGAKVLFSEDLSHGQVYGGVMVSNPFLVE